MSKLFFYDLETTGTKFWRNGIHQISGCIEINGVIKDKFNYKVKPYKDAIIENEALEVGGVTKEQIMAYADMDKVFAELTTILAKHVDKFNKTDKYHLVGFNNAAFDNQFFRAFFVQNAKTEKEREWGNYFGSWFWSDSIDVMGLASNYLKDKRKEMIDFKLKTVAKQLGIEIDESKLHDAEYDIELTRQIYNILNK